MAQYEAVFEIESKADAEAVRRLVERVYDVMREETREVYADEPDQSEMLDAFEAIRDAARHHGPGTLAIRYDQHDEAFGEQRSLDPGSG
jgi:DNA transposition AAA+ family ATPase